MNNLQKDNKIVSNFFISLKNELIEYCQEIVTLNVYKDLKIELSKKIIDQNEFCQLLGCYIRDAFQEMILKKSELFMNKTISLYEILKKQKQDLKQQVVNSPYGYLQKNSKILNKSSSYVNKTKKHFLQNDELVNLYLEKENKDKVINYLEKNNSLLEQKIKQLSFNNPKKREKSGEKFTILKKQTKIFGKQIKKIQDKFLKNKLTLKETKKQLQNIRQDFECEKELSLSLKLKVREIEEEIAFKNIQIEQLSQELREKNILISDQLKEIQELKETQEKHNKELEKTFEKKFSREYFLKIKELKKNFQMKFFQLENRRVKIRDKLINCDQFYMTKYVSKDIFNESIESKNKIIEMYKSKLQSFEQKFFKSKSIDQTNRDFSKTFN